jgi:C4-dicarboxylate-specific signal transduction histidine kinase
MSEVDGHEVCRRLKANPETREIPVIFLTAKTEVEDEKKGFELGAVDYIHKPFSPPIVLARVGTHLALQSALRAAHESSERLRSANKELESRVAAALEREQEKQSELARVTRMTTMGAFTASLAHEINQPLAAIITNSSAAARWLSSGQLNLDEARACLQRIGEDSNRAGQLVDSLQAMFRKEPVKKSLLAVDGIIRDALTLVQSTIQRRGVLVKNSLLGDLPLVLGDPMQLQQVIINLILNALDAMATITDRERLLDIRSSVGADGYVIVTIEDSGKGIDAAAMDHIFDAFFTTKPGGMGMGLSICRSIVEAHGGRLWASRRAPYGSIFQVALPGDDS